MKIQLPNGDYAETVCAIARASHRAGQPVYWPTLVAKSCEGEVFYYKATYRDPCSDIKAAKFYADGWLNEAKDLGYIPQF